MGNAFVSTATNQDSADTRCNIAHEGQDMPLLGLSFAPLPHSCFSMIDTLEKIWIEANNASKLFRSDGTISEITGICM
jgi:hypothetical protein